jgi:HEAT repeat protein
MLEQQLDLFADGRAPVLGGSAAIPDVPLALADMDDATLIAAIPGSCLGDSAALVAEAGRRRLAAAVPALEALCRRFSGFGAKRAVPEQSAALEALALIGGHQAAQAVSATIERAIVQGPLLLVAVSTAARLRATLSADVLCALLRHAEPRVRAEACRCACAVPDVILLLIDLLDDLNHTVASSAACALGQMGRSDALAALKRLLREEPSEEVIESIVPIADEECAVLLGRIARSGSGLSAAARAALDDIDHPRAEAIVSALGRPLLHPSSTVRFTK